MKNGSGREKPDLARKNGSGREKPDLAVKTGFGRENQIRPKKLQ